MKLFLGEEETNTAAVCFSEEDDGDYRETVA